MKKSTKLKTRLKPIITVFSVLALSCSAISYAGEHQSTLRPDQQTLDDITIKEDRDLLENSHALAVGLALKTFSPAIYRVLQDTKTNNFQHQQIALMKDVLTQLQTINQKLTDHLETPKPAELHQTFRERMNEIEIPSSGVVVSLVGDVKFASDLKSQFKKFHKIANQVNSGKSQSDEFARLPVGSIEGKKQTALAEIADYYTAQLTKSNDMFAKHGITELAMKPKSQAMDGYYIDSAGLKKPRIRAPEMKAGNYGIDMVLPSNFNFINSEALISAFAFVQEIFNRPSFQQDIAALIQKEIGKVTPLSTHQSTAKEQLNV